MTQTFTHTLYKVKKGNSKLRVCERVCFGVSHGKSEWVGREGLAGSPGEMGKEGRHRKH